MTHPRPKLFALSLTALVALSLACSDSTEPDNNNTTEVTLIDFAFSPANVTISAGDAIRWRNTTSTTHTVTPDGHSQWSRWETTTSGQTFEQTFNTPGTYDYFCEPHQGAGMTGTVTVQ